MFLLFNQDRTLCKFSTDLPDERATNSGQTVLLHEIDERLDGDGTYFLSDFLLIVDKSLM